MSLVPTTGHCSKWMQQSDNYECQPKSPVFSYVKRKPVNIAAPSLQSTPLRWPHTFLAASATSEEHTGTQGR